VDKYGWVDLGSSFLPSELVAAFLWAQLESLDKIQEMRKRIWDRYADRLAGLHRAGCLGLQAIPVHATNNAHMFYAICRSLDERTGLIAFLKARGVNAVFHYQSLHRSTFYGGRYHGPDLPCSDHYTDHLVRLPLFAGMTEQENDTVIDLLREYFRQEAD
jgi:dTDP-4-amino-4,6-dideoxygalactose transaminase